MEYLAVHKFAQEKNLLLFSDEVYRESEYNPATRLSAACDLGDYAISLGVTSKTYGLAGLRIGWIATKNKKIYQNMAGLKDYTTICNSAPSEFLAEVAMRNRQKLSERSLHIIKNNLTVIDDLFVRYADLLSWVRPKAGSMGFLLPGSVYDDSDNHFRLGLGRKNLWQAVERLEEFLNKM